MNQSARPGAGARVLFTLGRLSILAFLINLPITAVFLQVMGVANVVTPAPWTRIYIPQCAAVFYAISTYQPRLYADKLWYQLVFVNLSALPVSFVYGVVIYGLYLAGRKLMRVDR